LNDYDQRVVNKHVDDLSHVENGVMEVIIKKFNKKSRKDIPLTKTHGKALDYLSITIDYTKRYVENFKV